MSEGSNPFYKNRSGMKLHGGVKEVIGFNFRVSKSYKGEENVLDNKSSS